MQAQFIRFHCLVNLFQFKYSLNYSAGLNWQLFFHHTLISLAGDCHYIHLPVTVSIYSSFPANILSHSQFNNPHCRIAKLTWQSWQTGGFFVLCFNLKTLSHKVSCEFKKTPDIEPTELLILFCHKTPTSFGVNYKKHTYQTRFPAQA